MSKKQLHNRLDLLFSEIDSIVEPVFGEQIETPTGWWWECDENKHYTACGEEIFDCLGIPASRFQGQLITHYAVAAQSIQELEVVFARGVFPAELDAYFQSPEGAYLLVRFSIHLRPTFNSNKPGWRGYAQVLSNNLEAISTVESRKTHDKPSPPIKGLSEGQSKPSAILASEIIAQSISTDAAVADLSKKPAMIQIPIDLRAQGKGVLEIIDDNGDRTWSEDEWLLIQEVAQQLSTAIESAQSYELTQKAFQEIQLADHMKSQFLANMSHELRTPLNSIIGFSRVILKGIDGEINDIQRQDLTSIYNSGQHLLGLINDVLDISKIEAGKMELQFDDVNIIELINSVMSTAVGLVKDKPIKLQHILPESLPIVSADNTRIRQVLLNFLSNAAKFTEEGSITVKAIETLSPDREPEILVTVTDTGEGIAREDRDKLFQPFSQVDDSPTRKSGGTGLGLSICRSFMEMHQGRIGLLWSEVGQGSTFFFALPIHKNNAERPGEISHSRVQ